MADGEDALTDAEKDSITKKTRFDQLTIAFHAPEAYANYKANIEMENAKDQPAFDQDEKRASAMSSVKSMNDKDPKSGGSDAGDANIPPYSPLIPEQWLERCQEFGKFHIIKFPRLFQILFYFV